jgi:ABC-type phosphate/phosphonate transport system substrate-binding protein
MQQHPLIGHSMLHDSRSKFIALAAEISLGHHEKFDGTGYPNGLAGKAIPLESRIVAVADGLRDGAAVDSLVYDHLRQRDPALIARTKVIERWGPYGMPPVVVSPLLPAEEREQLRRVLFGMADQAAGRAALDQLGWDRFVPIDDAAYDPIRKMMAVVQGTGE